MRFQIWGCNKTMAKKRKNLLIWKSYVTITKTDAYISYKLQFQISFLTFIHKIISLRSATTILYRSPMAYNTTASYDKLTCTDYVEFRKCQDSFGQFSWSKNRSTCLDVKLKVFKKDDNKEFRVVQNPSTGEVHFNQFKRSRNQPVNAAEKPVREEKLSPVLKCPKTWMNNSNWLTRWFTWWTEQTERFV